MCPKSYRRCVCGRRLFPGSLFCRVCLFLVPVEALLSVRRPR